MENTKAQNSGPPEQERVSFDPPPRERGSSGLGTLIGVGTALAAGAGMVALLVNIGWALPLALATGGGLALLGGGLMVMQNHKESVNDAHARRSHFRDKEYHKEPEEVKDQSLLHLIKGANDLPDRTKFIQERYGVKPETANQYRGRHLPMGLLIGIGTALLAAAVLLPFLGAILPAGAALLTGTLALLAGGTAFAVHSAATMKGYEQYIDKLAKTEGEKAAKREKEEGKQAKQQPVEYDNARTRPGTFAGDVAASRQNTGPEAAQR